MTRTSTDAAVSDLAILGGQPIRGTKEPANPVFGGAAKDEVLAAIDAGTLAQFYGGAQVRRFGPRSRAGLLDGRRREIQPRHLISASRQIDGGIAWPTTGIEP